VTTVTIKELLSDYLACLYESQERMHERPECEHYSDGDRQAIADRIAAVAALLEGDTFVLVVDDEEGEPNIAVGPFLSRAAADEYRDRKVVFSLDCPGPDYATVLHLQSESRFP
jgi:hypothetical protein